MQKYKAKSTFVLLLGASCLCTCPVWAMKKTSGFAKRKGSFSCWACGKRFLWDSVRLEHELECPWFPGRANAPLCHLSLHQTLESGRAAYTTESKCLAGMPRKGVLVVMTPSQYEEWLKENQEEQSKNSFDDQRNESSVENSLVQSPNEQSEPEDSQDGAEKVHGEKSGEPVSLLAEQRDQKQEEWLEATLPTLSSDILGLHQENKNPTTVPWDDWGE